MYKEKLETKDLILTKANMSHTESLLKNFWSDEISSKYMFWRNSYTMDEAKIRMEKTIQYQKDNMAYIVIEKKSGEAIGLVGFTQIEEDIYEDRGIALGSKFTKKGYGKQILKAFLDYMFLELNAKSVIYCFVKENIASYKLQNHFNFKYVSSQPTIRERDNKECIIESYKLDKEDYEVNDNG